jgi:hypothetical protein
MAGTEGEQSPAWRQGTGAETALVSYEDCFMVGTKSGEGCPSWPQGRHSMFPT